MRLHHTRLRIKVKTPDAFEEHRTRHHAAAIAHEDFQEAELPRLQVDGVAASRYLAADEVDLKITDFEARLLALRVRTAGEGVDACEKLGKSKRLDEIVVGAGVETLDSIVNAAQSRQK